MKKYVGIRPRRGQDWIKKRNRKIKRAGRKNKKGWIGRQDDHQTDHGQSENVFSTVSL